MPTDISIEFIARQQERVINRLGSIEDQITVLTGIAIRLEGAVNGLAVEVRGLANGLGRVEHRLLKLEGETL